MLTIALLLFLAVAIGGDVMAVQIYLKKPVPIWLARGHVLVAVLGLATLSAALLTAGGASAAWIALALFAAGFAGGYFLFGFVFRGRRPPLWAVAAHGTLGWSAVVALFLGS